MDQLKTSLMVHTVYQLMGIFGDRLNFGSTAALNCRTGQKQRKIMQKKSSHCYSSCWFVTEVIESCISATQQALKEEAWLIPFRGVFTNYVDPIFHIIDILLYCYNVKSLYTVDISCLPTSSCQHR